MADDKNKNLDLAAIMKAVQEKNKAAAPKPKEAKPAKTLKGAKLTRTHKPKAERAEKPAEKPAKEPKALKTDMKTVARALTAADPREAIISLARSKESLDKLLENNANRARATKIIIDGVKAAMGKKGRDTTLALLESAESDEEAIGIVRGYLFGYVPSGNKLYAQEIAPLKKYGKKDMAAPLDADTLVAAAAYIWRWKKDNPKDQLDLRPEMPKDRETAKAEKAEKPEKDVPSIKAPEPRADATVLEQAKNALELSVAAKPAELLRLLGNMDRKSGANAEEAKAIAVQRLFNDLKANDPGFRAHLALFQKYDSISAEAVRLPDDKLDPRAGIATESMLGYLNRRATLGSWKVENLGWDFRALNIELGRKPGAGEGTKLPEGRAQFSDVLLGCAVYRWRQANLEKEGGAWAKPEKLPDKAPEPQKTKSWLVR
jgi:hypothetical protein